MSTPFAELASLDRLVHDPTRLAILTALSACQRADFLHLQRITGLTKGNLSAHVSKLEQAGWVVVEKRFVGKKPTTLIALSERGRAAVDEHWRKLEELREESRGWSADQLEPDMAFGST